MSAAPTNRRAVAEVDLGDGQSAPFKIGNRSIHQFWHLFSSHFRFVLLPPQRRPDSGRVAWTWREAAESRPVTPTELAEVRRRLTEGSRSLGGGFERAEADGAASLDAQVRPVVVEMIDQLVGQRDAALAGYVCRTDAGLMVHSWGATTAAKPYFPDAQHGEISGRLIADGDSAAGAEVALEHAAGGTITRVTADREGGFRFAHVAPGAYRIRVRDRSDFPEGGLTVDVEREAITGLELRAIGTASAGAAPAIQVEGRDDSRRRTRLFVWIFLLLLMAGGAGWWWWHRPPPPATVAANSASSGWQSADGSTPSPAASDPHRVGQDGAFSTLDKPRVPSVSADPKLKLPPREGPQAMSNSASSAAASSTPPAASSLVNPDKSDQSLRPKPESTKPVASGAPRTSPDADATPAAESDVRTEADAEVPAAVTAPSAAPGPQPTKAAVAPRAAVSPTAKPEPTAAQATPEGSADSPAAGGPAALSAQTASTAPTPKKSARAATTSAPATSATDTLAPGPASAAGSAEEPSPESVAGAPAASAKKPAAKPPATPSAPPTKSGTSETAELPPTENPPADPEAGALAAKPKPAAKGKTSPARATTAEAAEKEPPAPPEVAESSEATAPSPTPTPTSAPASKRNPTPATKPAVPGTPPEPPAALVELAVPATRVSPPEWTTVMGWRWTPWKARVVQDVILPTRPVTAAEEKQLGVLRAKLLAEQQARLPAALRTPRSMAGFTFVVTGATALVWNGSLTTATATGNRAEVTLPTEETAPGQAGELRDQTNRTVARVEVTADGSVRVRTTAMVQTNFWLALETGGIPLEWRRLAGAPWPEGWAVAGAPAGPMTRWQWALPAVHTPARVIDLSVVDPASGWALSRQVTVE